MDSSQRQPRLVLRMNAVVEGVEPGFEVFNAGFQWYAFLAGRCGFTIDKYDFIPPGGPPLPADYEGGSIPSLKSLAEFGLTVAVARAHTDFARDYFEKLNLALNAHQKVRVLLASNPYRGSEGVEFGEVFPCMSQVPLEDHLAMVPRAALRLDGKAAAHLSLMIDKPFLTSWMKTLEHSVEAGRRLELGLRFHILRDDDRKLHSTVQRFARGERTICSPSFAMRGISLAVYPERASPGRGSLRQP